MGTFTDQVQRLASEQLTARQRAEIKEKERAQLKQCKQDIYFYFLRCFEDSNNIDKTYIDLISPAQKAKTINFYLKNDNHYFDIDICYNSLLEKARKNFKVYNEKINKKEKINNKKIEFNLYQLIYNIFAENKNNLDKCYNSFTKLEIRRDIIQSLANNNTEAYLHLEKCYNRTLNNIYKTFKNAQITKSISTKKDIPKQEKTSKTFTILEIILYILSCIGSVLLFIFGLPFVIIFGFLKGKHGL